MNSKDILYQVALNLASLTTLGKLIYPMFWPTINLVLSDQHFWYERAKQVNAKLVPDSSLDWRRICISLEATSLDPDLVWTKLDYIPTLVVLTDTFGKQAWHWCSILRLWEQIETPEVLAWLLEHEIIEPDHCCAYKCLGVSISLERVDMLKPLFALLESQGEGDETYELDLLHQAIVQGRISLVNCLLETCQSLSQIDDTDLLLSSAIKSGQADMVEYILNKYTF
ncbi:Hypothetical protein POVR2_LOCUS74 [uncultured virus]|nr:Hypothetical protein POVR2_LOCUS74 [uncultured virus]